MKKIVGMVLVLLVFSVLVGCAATQKSVQEVIKWDQTNAATTRMAARQIARTWEMNSEALKVVLEKFKTLFPCDCLGDLKAMDDIVAKCKKVDAEGNLTGEELMDKDMGKLAVLWAYTWGSFVRSGLDKIMQVFFPALLAKILPYATLLGL
jgi:hypothetical protein